MLPERAGPVNEAELRMLGARRIRLSAEAEAIAAYVEQFMEGPAEGAGGVAALLAQLNPQTKIEVTDLDGYDWDWWTKYGEAVTDELSAATAVAITTSFPDIERPVAQRLAAEYAAARTARILQATGDQNLSVMACQRVGELVAGTIERGDSLRTLQAPLRSDLAFSPSRAELIARTETATAQGQRAKAAAAHFELNEKRWVTQGDALVTGECSANATAGWIPITDPFPSGQDTIPVHPNCRCNVIYRQQAPEEDQRALEQQPGALALTGTVLTVNCPQCGRRQPINNVRGTVDAYCRHW